MQVCLAYQGGEQSADDRDSAELVAQACSLDIGWRAVIEGFTYWEIIVELVLWWFVGDLIAVHIELLEDLHVSHCGHEPCKPLFEVLSGTLGSVNAARSRWMVAIAAGAHFYRGVFMFEHYADPHAFGVGVRCPCWAGYKFPTNYGSL